MKVAETVEETEVLIEYMDSLKSEGVIYLRPEAPSIKLKIRGGEIKLYGVPYTPLSVGPNAFMRERDVLVKKWEEVVEVEDGIDVLVSHSPPKGLCDRTRAGQKVGCEELRSAVGKIKPQLVVCGHIHEARGVEKVEWEGGKRNTLVVNAAVIDRGKVSADGVQTVVVKSRVLHQA
jgi:Icc-related predicted phosphoesterase